jgi:hypothetical protein
METAPKDPLIVVEPALIVRVLLADPRVMVPVGESVPRFNEDDPVKVVVVPVKFRVVEPVTVVEGALMEIEAPLKVTVLLELPRIMPPTVLSFPLLHSEYP